MGRGCGNIQRDTRDASNMRKDHLRMQLEGGHCKQRREASEETEAADTLNLDFQHPELSANKLLKLPRAWCFLTVALEN